MLNKQLLYNELLQKRKSFVFHDLLNPSEIEKGIYDSDHVELWAKWLGNLDAKIMLIGKDFGGLGFFIKYKGECNPDSTTNKNLIKLFSIMGIDIGTPSKPNKDAPVFLTNSVFGIINTQSKGGNYIKSIQKKENACEFLRPLIEIIKPKIVIAMGAEAYKCVALAYKINRIKSLMLAQRDSPYEISDHMLLFPVFHCGGLGLINRSLDKQIDDWKKIEKFI